MSPKNEFGYIPARRKDRNSIGRVVAELRESQALTQDDLAGRCGVVGWDISRDAVKRIESGEREVNDIEIRFLAKALRVPIAVLFK